MFPFADNNPTHRTAFVTYAIILANVLSFLWVGRLNEQDQVIATVKYGFIPARVAQLRDPELVVDVPVGQELVERAGAVPAKKVVAIRVLPDSGDIYRSVFTCMFLHGGWMHLIGNMWFLFIFGNNIEDRLGHVVYLVFYLLGGLAATAAHWATDPSSAIPVIGASGAVAAVLGAYAVTYPFARVHTLIFLFIFITVIDLPALAVLGFWFLGQLLEYVGTLRMNVNGGVAFAAHIGGFVVGAVLMPLLRRLIPPDGPAVEIVGEKNSAGRGFGRRW